jgi:hypothetical protein
MSHLEIMPPAKLLQEAFESELCISMIGQAIAPSALMMLPVPG